MTFTLTKATADAPWSRLLRSKKKAGNMHTWWAMKEKYEEELRNSTLRAEAQAQNATAQAQNASTPTPVAPVATEPARSGGGDAASGPASLDAAPSTWEGEVGSSTGEGAEAAAPPPVAESADDNVPVRPPGMPAPAKEEL